MGGCVTLLTSGNYAKWIASSHSFILTRDRQSTSLFASQNKTEVWRHRDGLRAEPGQGLLQICSVFQLYTSQHSQPLLSSEPRRHGEMAQRVKQAITEPSGLLFHG